MNTTKNIVIVVAAVSGSFLAIKSPLRDKFLSAQLPPAVGYIAAPVNNATDNSVKKISVNTAKNGLVKFVEQENKPLLMLNKERGIVNIKQEITKGIVFRIQVLASNAPVPLNSERFNGCRNVKEYYMNGIYKYTAGEFKTPRESESMFFDLKDKGFNDTFLIALNDDKPMKMTDAMAAIRR